MKNVLGIVKEMVLAVLGGIFEVVAEFQDWIYRKGFRS